MSYFYKNRIESDTVIHNQKYKDSDMTTLAKKYLLEIRIYRNIERCEITYQNGTKSSDGSVAQFFKIMEDRQYDCDDIMAYIKLGRRIDPAKNWDEAERIINTFIAGEKQ
jgi:hypothetical protein